jgi:hypothetical protein
MFVTQYTRRLLADYDMGLIRKLAAERGPIGALPLLYCGGEVPAKSTGRYESPKGACNDDTCDRNDLGFAAADELGVGRAARKTNHYSSL